MIAVIDRILDRMAKAAAIGYRMILVFIVCMMFVGVLNRLTGFTVKTPTSQALLFTVLLLLSLFVALLLARKAKRAKSKKANPGIARARQAAAANFVAKPTPKAGPEISTSAMPNAAPKPKPDDDVMAYIDSMYAQIPASDDPDAPPDPLVEQVHDKPIVFGRYCPLPTEPTLTFMGGLPIGPATLQWPEGKTVNGDQIPLHFIMQWDCATLSKVDPSGCLPKEGVLYFFSATEWGVSFDCRFIHYSGPNDDWQPLSPPDNMPAVMGADGAWSVPYVAMDGIPKEERSHFAADSPVLLPKWAFEPLALEYPALERGPDWDDEDVDHYAAYWGESNGIKEALYALQQSWSPLPDKVDLQTPLADERPFQAFPHDWAAVRIFAAKTLQNLRWPVSDSQWQRLWPDIDESERQTRLDGWYKEARELYEFARQFALTDALEPAMREMAWEWMQAARAANVASHDYAVRESVMTSLGLNSAAVFEIPGELIEEARRRLALASATIRPAYYHEMKEQLSEIASADHRMALYEQLKSEVKLQTKRDIHAPTPARMFGRPTCVQDEMERYIGAWILLLEFSSGDIDGLDLGEGVLKYLIRPEDLRAGRFDRVEVVASAY